MRLPHASMPNPLKNLSGVGRVLLAVLAVGWGGWGGAGGNIARAGQPLIVFTGEPSFVPLPANADAKAYDAPHTLAVGTPEGFQFRGERPTLRGGLDISGVPDADAPRHILLTPEDEGIQTLTFPSGRMLRFLAITPPSPRAPTAWRVGGDIFADEAKKDQAGAFVLGAYGDSVTATGPYPEILARMIERAAGRPNGFVRVVRRAHSGRSIDATLRNFNRDIASDPPHLAVVMYGLNDQGAGGDVTAFLEQAVALGRAITALGEPGAPCLSHRPPDAVDDAAAADDDGTPGRRKPKTQVMFLSATPHIDRGKEGNDPATYAFRTLAFSTLLRERVRERGWLWTDAFAAMWGPGRETLEASVDGLRPLFPLSYREPLSLLTEKTPPRGDTIHPNALGHLRIARAIFEAMGTEARPPAPTPAGEPEPPSAPVLTASATVRHATETIGIECVFSAPPPHGAELTLYALPSRRLLTRHRFDAPVAPKANTPESLPLRLTVDWPSAWIADPDDADTREWLADRGVLAAQWTVDGHTRVVGVRVPLRPSLAEDGRAPEPAVAGTPPQQRPPVPRRTLVYERRRWHDVTKSWVHAPLSTALDARAPDAPEPMPQEFVRVEWPEDREAGYVDLARSTVDDRARLWYLRYLAVAAAEAGVDGDLAEWTDDDFRDFGDVQNARWTDGFRDRRPSPETCRPSFALRAGAEGLYGAVRVKGGGAKDTLTVFFDPRPKAALGTPGGYYWIDLKWKDNTPHLSLGETTPATARKSARVAGRVITLPAPSPATGAEDATPADAPAPPSGTPRAEMIVSSIVEFFIPYAALALDAWPVEGDMGISLWYRHVDAENRTTHLQWADVGHPWNTLWYGVARRAPEGPLPYRVGIQ